MVAKRDALTAKLATALTRELARLAEEGKIVRGGGATPVKPIRRFLVAYSGGVDSLALLDALQDLRKRSARWRRFAVRAVYIDHQLQPGSGAWAKQCRAICRRLAVPLLVRRVRVQASGRSLEAAAREARYAALATLLRSDEALLTAHHLDDQLETFLLQWLRGAGVSGLAAMPAAAAFAKSVHLRPLLECARAELESWVDARGIAYVCDPSNTDERFDRNYLRATVIPLLQSRWPAVARVTARTAVHLGEAKDLLAALAQMDLQRLLVDGCIQVAALKTLDAARQRNALRYWLRQSGLGMPDARHLERIRLELPRARADAQPWVRWSGGEVRRFRGKLYARPPQPPDPPETVAAGKRAVKNTPDRVHRWQWRTGKSLSLGAGRGRLRLAADPLGSISAAALPATLLVRTRTGGERLRPAVRGSSVTLKEWLRRSAVLPWEREQLPLVFADEHLMAVADLAVDARYARQPSERSGLRLIWEQAPRIRA